MMNIMDIHHSAFIILHCHWGRMYQGGEDALQAT